MRIFVSYLLLSVLIVGCETATYELVPATGNLTIDGKPAGGIMVQFVPDIVEETIPAPTSQALTNESGDFELYTLKNERGAIVGTHRVSLFDTEEERVAQGKESTQPQRLDKKYASGHIRVDVVEGQTVKLEAESPGN